LQIKLVIKIEAHKHDKIAGRCLSEWRELKDAFRFRKNNFRSSQLKAEGFSLIKCKAVKGLPKI
jgi:hypothetical protein